MLTDHAPVRREVKADDGSWFMRGMLPYRGEDGQVDGTVITFAGISEIKAAEREIEAARAYLDSIIATIRQPLVVLDEDLRVVSASSSFHRIFSVKPEDLIGRQLRAAGDHLDVSALREFLASIQALGTTISDQEIEMELPGLGRRSFSMSARVLREEPQQGARSWWRSLTSPTSSARAKRWSSKIGGRAGQCRQVALSRGCQS